MCGLFGIFGSPQAGELTALGLHALQHRGQEAAGIIAWNEEDPFHPEKVLGLVGGIYSNQKRMDRLRGSSAIGHTRYSTSKKHEDKEKTKRNVQPFYAQIATGEFALAHNGNITNADLLKKALIQKGSIFLSSSDTEVIQHLMAHDIQDSTLKRLVSACSDLKGAYSLVVLTEHELIGVRDPYGFRPLVLGKVGGAFVLASETCALEIVEADYVRDIAPGEVVVISKDGMKSFFPFRKRESRFCIFEHVYFSRPDSIFGTINAGEARVGLGHVLAQESPVEADVVVAVPDSGSPAALGFAEELGIPFRFGIFRNQYIGRTFIEPQQKIRNLGVKLKLSFNHHITRGKRVVIVDDSLVRGTTMARMVKMMKDVKEVHVRIASPQTINSCFWGIDTPCKDDLIASQMNLEELRRHLNVDTLAFISLGGLHRGIANSSENLSSSFCDYCFTGKHPEE